MQSGIADGDWDPTVGDSQYVYDNYFHVTVWIFSTDQGGEQVGAAGLLGADCRCHSLILMFRQ
eukprot:4440262-Pyramimonas_sp.AAC.1